MKKKTINRTVIGGLLITVLAVGGFWFYNTQNIKAATPSYITSSVRMGNVEKSVSATGTLQPVNQYNSNFGFE